MTADEKKHNLKLRPRCFKKQKKHKNKEQKDLKDSAKAKLVAGEALTQEEADTIVL